MPSTTRARAAGGDEVREARAGRRRRRSMAPRRSVPSSSWGREATGEEEEEGGGGTPPFGCGCGGWKAPAGAASAARRSSRAETSGDAEDDRALMGRKIWMV